MSWVHKGCKTVASHGLNALASFALRLHPKSVQDDVRSQQYRLMQVKDRTPITQEAMRLQQAQERTAHWRRWGPYLSERQWGTVREDYSPTGAAWEYFPHDHARSRAYRWGEDGLCGISDNHQRALRLHRPCHPSRGRRPHEPV